MRYAWYARILLYQLYSKTAGLSLRIQIVKHCLRLQRHQKSLDMTIKQLEQLSGLMSKLLLVERHGQYVR
jgi:hypothetical protein